MTKQELLTKLATECATWEEARHGMVNHFLAIGDVPYGYEFAEYEWLAERERLLNKPSWADAPEGATHLAFNNYRAVWCWYTCEPFTEEEYGEWAILSASGSICLASQAIAIPAGYDWEQSLEERPV